MAACFGAFSLGKKKRAKAAALPSPAAVPPPPLPCSFFASSSSRPQKKNAQAHPSEMENMEKKRWDSLESWSMLLDPGNAESSDANAGEREEWMADLSQLFIGNKFASGSNSRIYRGIYKQRAVAVKMVRLPEQDDERRAVLEKQFNAEVAFLCRLCHPNIVQFIAACRKPPVYSIIMEYMSQGTLRMYLHKKVPYSLSTETILRLQTLAPHAWRLSAESPKATWELIAGWLRK